MQNEVIDLLFTEDHRNIWIENAFVGNGWSISTNNVITGVSENDWQVDLPGGINIDMVPENEMGYAVWPYRMETLLRCRSDGQRAFIRRRERSLAASETFYD